MKNRLWLVLLVIVGGCASVDSYSPYVVDISQPDVLIVDEKQCLAAADAYTAPLNLNAVASGAAQGAANNASGAALNPLVPVLGAAGGATSALLSGLGVLNNDQRRVFLLCLSHRGERSHAYNVVDPNS